MAITGEPFCNSARKAFFVIWANLMRVAVMTMFTWIIIWIGKVLVALVPTAAGVFFYMYYFEDDYDGIILPGVAMLAINWMVSSGFMTVYETAVDTIFLCFLLDEQANKQAGKMFAEKELAEIV